MSAEPSATWTCGATGRTRSSPRPAWSIACRSRRGIIAYEGRSWYRWLDLADFLTEYPCSRPGSLIRTRSLGDSMANFGTVGVDWQQRVNWDRLRKYRLERARERMKAHNLGALLLMYDENVRYVTSTLTPGWNRLKPRLRYALLCGDGPPGVFEQGGIRFQIQRPP